MTDVLGLISWLPERLLRGFKYSHFCSSSPAELIRFHHSLLWIFLLAFLFVCFVDGCVTTGLCNCLLEVSVDDILSQVYNNAHTYTQTYINIYINIYIYINRYVNIYINIYINSSNKRYVFCLIFSAQHIHTLVYCSYMYIYI